MRAVDALMLGSASGLAATAATILNVNLVPVALETGLSASIVVAIAQLVMVVKAG